jgi:hypothetical protein
MSQITTGHDLWSNLVERAGLDLRNYDSSVADDFRCHLRLDETEEISSQLERKNIGPEAVLAGFFRVLQPFTQIYNGILRLIENIGLSEGEENLLIQFDFGLGKELKLDLENFRKQIERWRNAVRSISIERWNSNRLWDLWEAFGSYVGYDQALEDSRIQPWVEQYRAGIWPEIDLEPPAFDNPELNDYVARAWSIRRSMIEAARQAGPLTSDLSRYGFARAEIAVMDGYVEVTDEVGGTLRSLHSDHWAESLAAKVYARADEARSDDSLSSKLIEDLRGVLDTPPPEHRDVETAIREIEELLSLPIWKFRYELYSIWVLTRITDALGGTEKLRFSLEGNVFHIPFKAARIAILETVEPAVSVWSEVRFPLANPRGKGRKHGIQPDYSLTTDSQEPPEKAFVLVECKQYLRSAPQSFTDVVLDYTDGQPEALVMLVNYGPINRSVGDNLPPPVQSRTSLIEYFRPLQPGSLRKFDENLRDQVSRHSRERMAKPEFSWPDDTDPSAVGLYKAEIELRWRERPTDLDLYVFLPLEEGIESVSYSNKGSMEHWPWLALAQDVTQGHGPEVVRIKDALGGYYRVAVNLFSKDAPLAGSGATVSLKVRGASPIEFECPGAGGGKWWYVADINFLSGQIIKVNSIINSLPEGMPRA